MFIVTNYYLLGKNVDRIDKAIDDMLHYSYQYNLKIVGVPLVNENESSEDTANLCLKLFSALGNDISVYDIDIAHRVPQRNAAIDNGRRITWLSFFHKFKIGDNSVDHFSLSNLLASRSDRIRTLSWLIT